MKPRLAAFLRYLAQGLGTTEAAIQADLDLGYLYTYRRAHADFRAEWAAAVESRVQERPRPKPKPSKRAGEVRAGERRRIKSAARGLQPVDGWLR